MCRNIKTLYNFEPPATDDEINQAALQFVRKLSGFTNPLHANKTAFDHAVAEISASSVKLLSRPQLPKTVKLKPPKHMVAQSEKTILEQSDVEN